MAAPASSQVLSLLSSGVRAFSIGTLLFAACVTHAVKWAPPNPEELADMTPQVDPEAGAEILLNEVHVEDYEANHAKIVTRVRVKIYNQRGVDANTLMEIPYSPRTRFNEIAVRTIKPNGEILELNPQDIYDTERRKEGKVREKVKSFAPPGVVPGAIIEYLISEKRLGDNYPFDMWFQRGLPTRLARYRFDGEDFKYWGLFPRPLNCPGLKITKDKRGDQIFELTQIPAWEDEPLQPPLLNIRPVVVLFCRFNNFSWSTVSNEWHATLEQEAKTTKTITETLSKIVGPKDTNEEKLRKIYDYCRTKILNRDQATTRLTDEQWKKVNRDASDTLKTGHGSSRDINILFAALVRAAGFEATIALSNNRDRFFLGFYKNASTLPADPFVYTAPIVAVTDKEKTYRLFDPGSTYLPFEELSWTNSETAILITGKGIPNAIHFSAPPAADSVCTREATLALGEDGTLEGDVTLNYTGLWQTAMKQDLAAATDEERANSIKDSVTVALKRAELTDIKILNADQPHLPLSVTYHLRVPDYAERTGSRLFIQPAVFHKGRPALFTNPKRKNDMICNYRSIEEDKLTIQLPADYALEAGSSPGKVPLGQIGDYEHVIGINPKKNTLTVSRKYTHRLLSAPAKSYPAIKEAFDSMHVRDNHVLTFKRKAASEQTAPAAPAP